MKVQCSLLMLYLLVGLLTLPRISAQSNATALDDVLQDYAFRAFIDPKTGVPYEAMVPENLTGIKITALRLRSGSLYKRGRSYKEFDIPVRTVVTPYVERLALVYQNLGNWSEVYYPLEGYRYLSPVLGLRAYDSRNLSGVKFPELVIKASAKPILISFVDVKLLPAGAGAVAKCVWFDLQGGTYFSNVTSGNVCSTLELGHFSIVTEVIAPSPAPRGGNPVTGLGKKIKTKTWIIIGSAVGGSAVVLVLFALMVILILKIKRTKQMQRMEKAAKTGEAFRTISVGATRSPTALRTRTAPMIENEYVP
ncbi:unnamed protein product [Rhodiola kirilowii]